VSPVLTTNGVADRILMIGATASDLHSFPKDLRNVLERCLGEDPTPQVLASYMPEIRQILYKLLQGLQSKQPAWKAAASSVQYDMPPPDY
jgi:hypothetical protein